MIYFFTGAGVSADSGIPTFRDEGGIWTKHKIEEVCYLPTFLESEDIHNYIPVSEKIPLIILSELISLRHQDLQ